MYSRSPLFIFILLISTVGIGCTQEAWTDRSRALPDELREVPEAIFIRHTPNPNYPEQTQDEDKDNGQYVWKHSTSIISMDQDLKVVKAGSFIWYDETGWKRNVEYDRRDVINRFGCPKGLLKKGERYTFEKNYRWGNHLYGGDALWYVIAKDKDGKLYKGMALIETESTLQSN